MRDAEGAVVGTVSEATYTGRGLSGVLLSVRDGNAYTLWWVTTEGKRLATMTTGDEIAARSAYEKRVAMVRATVPDDKN